MSAAEEADDIDLTPRGVLRFFLAETEGYPVAILRILMGLFAIWKGYAAFINLDRYFTEDGILPWRHVQNSEHQIFSILALAPESRSFTLAVILAHIAAGLTLTVGLFPRISAFVVYLCGVGLMHRNPFIDNRGDHLFVLVVGLCALMPIGRVWSVHAWLAAKRGIVLPLKSMWSQRLLALQVSYIYLYAFGVKFRASGWHDGSAIYHTFASPELVEWPMEIHSKVVLLALSWFTIGLEMLFPILVWNRVLRPYCIIAGILFHAGIEITMRIPVFSTMMMVTYASFLSDEEVKTFFAKIGLSSWAPDTAPAAGEDDTAADDTAGEDTTEDDPDPRPPDT
jgi:uncharacterized membrane protein YphA (DoxX/SURF4 family)